MMMLILSLIEKDIEIANSCLVEKGGGLPKSMRFFDSGGFRQQKSEK